MFSYGGCDDACVGVIVGEVSQRYNRARCCFGTTTFSSPSLARFSQCGDLDALHSSSDHASPDLLSSVACIDVCCMLAEALFAGLHPTVGKHFV